MILVIAEKKSIAACLKDAGLLPEDTDIVYTLGMGLWRYQIERLQPSQVPFTGPIKKYAPRDLLAATLFKSFHVDFATNDLAVVEALVKTIQVKLPQYTEIVMAVDPDGRGVFAGNQLLERLCEPYGLGKPPAYALELYQYHPDHLRAQWETRANRPWSEWAAPALHRQTRKYLFDFWWSSNAAVVYSELCSFTGVKGDPIVSKYELMVTAFLGYIGKHQNWHQVSEAALLQMLQDWKGTGKYSNSARIERIEIGSPSSRMEILNQANQRGLIEQATCDDKGRQEYALTAKGHAFLNYLHPKSYDLDLPYRLNEWITTGDTDSMERYIRTHFGRQLRYQRYVRKQFNLPQQST
jgi:DNA-binding PadR family transcriptional regulator